MKKYLTLSLLTLLTSCIGHHYFKIDDWQGKYTLWEYNSCCDQKKPVLMELTKTQANEYDWIMFRKDSIHTDTLRRTARYVNTALRFRTRDAKLAEEYFTGKVHSNDLLFTIRYDGFKAEDKKTYWIGHYTKWNMYLKGYKNNNVLFGSTNYHFKKENEREKRIPVDEMKK